MRHARQRRPQHLFKGQIGAMVGMQARAHVRQPTGGRPQHPVAVAEHRRQPLERRADPGIQGVAELRGDAMLGDQGFTALDQRVEVAGLRRHGVQQHALTHAIGRDDNPLDAQPLDQPVQHQGRIGQGVDALLGQTLDPLQRRPGLLLDEPGQLQGVGPGDLVLMGDMQRVVGQLHVQQRQVSPGAADRVEVRAGKAVGQRPEVVVDDAPHPLGVQRLGGPQRKGAQRQGGALGRPDTVQTHQLQAGSAQVADHPLGVGLAADHPQGGVTGLFLAGQDADLQARLGLHPGQERLAVRRIAHGGGGGGGHFLGLPPVQHGAEPAERADGRLNALG